MEDFKRRLEYQNTSVQLQAVSKLYEEVKKKKPKGQLISSSTPEFSELKLLWQYTGADKPLVARSCCQKLVQLLKDQCAEFTYVQNGFLNQVPTAKCLYGIIEGISQLLMLQVIVKLTVGESYTCPYQIRNPPHPFISVVTNRPAESWPLIVEQIDKLFTIAEPSIKKKALPMLDPFIKFVLLDPKCNDQYSRLRWALKTRLVELTSRIDDVALKNLNFQYLVTLLPSMQISCKENVEETSQFCAQLLYLYCNHEDDLDLDVGKNLVTYSLELCKVSQSMGIDSHAVLQALLHLSRKTPQVFIKDENLALLGQGMLSCLPDDNLHFLHIVKTILKVGQGAVSPLGAGFVGLVTINLVANQSSVTTATQQKQLTLLASDVMVLVESYDLDSTECSNQLYTPNLMCSQDYEVQQCVRLAHQFSRDQNALRRWLVRIEKHIARLQTVPLCLTNLLVTVLLKIPDKETSLLAINRLTDVVKTDSTNGLYLLPVYLYVLGKRCCPTVRLHILSALPKLASHKFNVASVLKTLQNLMLSPKLKSLSIRLLTELWSLQDRCFPHLLKVITETGKGDVTMVSVTDDVTLAKAQAIKEICRLRPEQHGAELLGPLSETLNLCTDVRSGPAAALCLEALFYVCQAEVIDIMSAWKVLESQLIKDTRSVVKVKVCELLSLVPSLQVKSPEYEVFLHESLRRLWILTECDDDLVVSAAFSALSQYNMELFKISHLKYQIVEDFVAQAQAVLAQSDNEEDTVDTVLPFVPGVCYTRLLCLVRHGAVKGFSDFLSGVIAQEVENLPRGIFFTSLRQPGPTANQGKEISGIPSFMQSQYEKTKQPGLRPALAVALLLCYDPPVEVGRDGRPRKHYVMSHGKAFQQMFTTLLQDVPVQPSEWYRTSLMGQAWSNFVQRLFAAMLQARQAEIDLQLNRDFIDEKEAGEKRMSAWMWVRDTLVDVIKKSTKGNPSVQFNSILALSGLAGAVNRYVSSLSEEERKQADSITEHTSHSHWLLIVIDSCMSLVDFQYQPKASLLGLCQQRTVDDRLPSSILGQAAAILALCQIAPLIVANSIELVYELLEKLTVWLPWKQTDEESPPVLHFFRGYSLGVLLEKLVTENFPEIAGSRGSLAVWKALDSLEEFCLSTSDNRTGALLGLSVCLVAVCQDGKTESRVHVTSVQAKLGSLVNNITAEDPAFQPLCVCLAAVTGAGFTCNILDKDVIDSTVKVLQSYQETISQNAGVTRALGMLCYSAESAGHPTIGQLIHSLHSDWMKCLNNGEQTELDRVAALTGLMALTGCNKVTSDADMKTASQSSSWSIDAVTRCCRNLVTSTDLVGIQAAASWLLGNMYMSASNISYSSGTAPGSYSYLQESSVLRAVVDFLTQAGKQGPEFIPSEQVKICLQSLQRKATGNLPPLNWMGVLSPLMKLPFEEEVKLLCIQLAVKISRSAPSAALFLAAWIVPPLFNTLNMSCQQVLLSSTGHYVKTVTPSTLQSFLDKSCKPFFVGCDTNKSFRLAVLRGLNSALQVPDPPDSVTAILYEMVEFVYEKLETQADEAVLTSLGDCLSHVPDTVLDKLTAGDCTNNFSIVRGTIVRCYLVGHGHQPISLLNSCIDSAFNINCDHDKLLWYIANSFDEMKTLEGARSQLMARVQWLLEIAGHTKNILAGSFKLSTQNVDIKEICTFAVGIIASAVCLWTGRTASSCILGLDSHLLSVPQSDWLDVAMTTISSSKSHDDMEPKPFDWMNEIQPVECMPSCIPNLVHEPWTQILSKIVDWHVSMLELSEDTVGKYVKKKLTESLTCLRHCQDYGKLSTWTKAVLLTATA